MRAHFCQTFNSAIAPFFFNGLSLFLFVHKEVCLKFARSSAKANSLMVLAYGVIGNTADFGSVVLGSSPSRPTKKIPK